jgi:tetratricopeptide (TPR) repeat protein
MTRDRVAAPLFALILLACSTATTSADWPVPRGPSHEPSPYHYDPAHARQVPRQFLDDAPACILYAGSTYLVEPDGTIETIVHEVTRFNGRKGIDKLGEYKNVTYDPSFQKLTLNEACVHKAGGRTVPIEPRHVQLRDVSTDYQVYDHEKQLVISFPNLELGDVLEVKWTTRGKNPEHGGQFFTRYTFGDDQYPAVRDELRVRLPRDRQLKYAATLPSPLGGEGSGVRGEGRPLTPGPSPTKGRGGQFEPVVRDEGETRLYTWRADNRPQLPQDDSLPSKEDLRLEVACSTFASWEAVGRWKVQLRADCWECTQEIRKVVADVVRDLKTPLEKARALAYWVRRNIRYVSAGEKHDYTPHRPALVLGNRYGDCKDQTQLLAVMLREAGIDVALATLGVRDDGQVLESVPSPWGTHAILLVTIADRQHWIDTTATLCGWDFLPRDDRDRLCYVVDDKGALRLVRTPVLTADDNRIEQVTHASIGADGSSRNERTVTYHGQAAYAQRETWVDVPAGERRRLMTAELQDANSKTRLTRLNVDEKKLQDYDQPARAEMVFEILGQFTGSPDREGSVADSKVWTKLLSYNLDYDRAAPLDLWAPADLRHRFVLDLAPAYYFDGLPREHDLQSKWGSFSLKVTADGDNPRHMELDFRLRLERVRIEPADFDAFRRFHEDVGKYYRVWLTLKPADDLDDVPALEALFARAPDDSATAAVLARLYLQSGLGRDARRVLERARYYRPGDATLWELTVKAAETTEDEEAAYREMVRRFPEEPRYALALGAALVNLGELKKAREVLAPIARTGGATLRSQAHYHLARGLLQKKQAEKALHEFEAAAKADPDTVHTVAGWQLRGRIHEQLGKAKEAVSDYREALRLDSDSEEALGALVRLSLASGAKTEALDYLRRYTLAVGQELAGLAQAAEWHLRLGRYEDAFDLASRAREIGFHEKAQRVLGLVYLHRNDFDKAVLHLGKADPDAEVLEGLIRGHLLLGNLRDAELCVLQADKLDDRPAALRRACDRVKRLVERQQALLKEAKPPEDKLNAWRSAINRCVCAEEFRRDTAVSTRVQALLAGAFGDGIDLGPAFGLRALLSLERGQLGKALADAERAVSLSPGETTGHYVRGRVRLERGMEGALTDLEKAAELSKRRDAAVLHWLAQALSRAGKSQDALRVQREAVKLKPRDGELLEQLHELEKVETAPVGGR